MLHRTAAVAAYAARVAILAAIAAGCSAAPPQPVTESGFYRHDNEPTVFRFDKSKNAVCSVISMPQLAAFGASDRVNVVSASTDIIGGRAVSSCAWPAGTYRDDGTGTIYRLDAGTRACKTARDSNDVKRVPADANLLVGRKLVGSCPKER